MNISAVGSITATLSVVTDTNFSARFWMDFDKELTVFTFVILGLGVAAIGTFSPLSKPFEDGCCPSLKGNPPWPGVAYILCHRS